MSQIINDFSGWLLTFLISLPGIVLGLVLHEYAHGRVADWLGDPTPYEQGRLTLNPLPHIDWLGFLMIALFRFGWAKPVEVNPYRFQRMDMKKGMMLVSLAGPIMNLILASIGAVIFHALSGIQGSDWATWLQLIVLWLVYINLILAVFNLIPVPPLDGSKILAGVLPDAGARFIYSLEPYGFVILLLLIMTNITGQILFPVVQLFAGILGVPLF